jgi:hypothetical protein
MEKEKMVRETIIITMVVAVARARGIMAEEDAEDAKETKEVAAEEAVKLLPLPQPQLRARTNAQTNPSAQRATPLRSVLARVCSVSRQNLNTTTVP